MSIEYGVERRFQLVDEENQSSHRIVVNELLLNFVHHLQIVLSTALTQYFSIIYYRACADSN